MSNFLKGRGTRDDGQAGRFYNCLHRFSCGARLHPPRTKFHLPQVAAAATFGGPLSYCRTRVPGSDYHCYLSPHAPAFMSLTALSIPGGRLWRIFGIVLLAWLVAHARCRVGMTPASLRRRPAAAESQLWICNDISNLSDMGRRLMEWGWVAPYRGTIAATPPRVACCTCLWAVLVKSHDSRTSRAMMRPREPVRMTLLSSSPHIW
ncbi:hypothetical protein B0T14DRAFT_287732 [Immersiella caudata]|uniref:Uncharacterized protein n=1 Tax=Immersiella caudata TaxID=314043 RepID=A0AA39WEE0_9PEZI|nr:hypothetical protein B0T14DRAFT_287732 [Immersiella caudata]